MLSMTGYGLGTAPIGGGHVIVSARAINHRYLDVRVKTTPELADLSDMIESAVRQQAGRGRVEINARLEGAAASTVTLDLKRASRALAELRALRDHVAPDEPVPLLLLGSVPGLFSETSTFTNDDLRRAIDAALADTMRELKQMRTDEGRSLTRDILGRIERVRVLATDVAQRTPNLTSDYRTKLNARIAKLLADGALTHDPARLETEIAIFADRADVTEEITRLCTHCDHFASVAGVDDAVGRKLDFLLQEMGREANTIGSKIGDAAITHMVVEIKTELERVREQVQNVL